MSQESSETDGTIASGWDAHRAARLRAWLRLSYEDRLKWLGQAKDFARRAGDAARARREIKE